MDAHDHKISEMDTEGSSLLGSKVKDGPFDGGLDEGSVVQDRGSSAPAFYTPSMMLNTMNETMANVGGSVEVRFLPAAAATLVDDMRGARTKARRLGERASGFYPKAHAHRAPSASFSLV